MKTPEQLAEERYPIYIGMSGEEADRYEAKRDGYAAAIRDHSFQANEGPSVEDIKKAVEEVLDEHGLEIDGNANVELHRDLVARLSALFTQTQVEP